MSRTRRLTALALVFILLSGLSSAALAGEPVQRGPAQPNIVLTAKVYEDGYVLGFTYSGFTANMVPSLETITAADFVLSGTSSAVTDVAVDGADLVLTVAPPFLSNSYGIEYIGNLPVWLDFAKEDVDHLDVEQYTEVGDGILSVHALTDMGWWGQRVTGVVLEFSEEVDASRLNIADFAVRDTSFNPCYVVTPYTCNIWESPLLNFDFHARGHMERALDLTVLGLFLSSPKPASDYKIKLRH